ncbi:MAG: DUF5652 family protein [Patescibacteria group bacterium]
MEYTDFASLPFLQGFGPYLIFVLIIALIWTMVIKGIALWHAARNGHKIWFVVLLVVNTIGILELLYVLVFSKKDTASQTPVPEVSQ